MIMSFEGYQEALQKQQEKESEVQILKQKYEKYEESMSTIRKEMEEKFQKILEKIEVAKLK